MFLLQWIRLFRGFFVVEIRGTFPERFLNLVARRNIDFWNARCCPSGLLIKVARRQKNQLQKIAEDAGCEAIIREERGLPHYLSCYRKRVGLLLGGLCFFLILFFASQFIWSVTFIGNAEIDVETIRKSLGEYGLSPGVRASKINTEGIKNQLMMEFDDLSFVGITIEGVKAVVELQKRVPVPEDLSGGEPCNMVAAVPGQILRVEALAGETMVQEGQFVQEGELIISGVLDSTSMGARFVAAQGKVLAKTWRNFQETIALKGERMEKTGETSKRFSLLLFGMEIKLYGNSGIPYQNYDTIKKEKNLEIKNSFSLPVALIEEEIWELSPVKYEYSVEEGQEQGEKLCLEKLLKVSPEAKILNHTTKVEKQGENLIVFVELECEEEIGKQQEINVSLEGAHWQND